MSSIYGYGHISDKTKRVKALIEDVTALGNNPTPDIGVVRQLIQSIDQEFTTIDDAFVSSARQILLGIAEDGIIDADERKQLRNLSEAFENPISNQPVGLISNRKFVLTGDFDISGGKPTVKKMIEADGGKVSSSVSKKTDYVVVGNKGSDAWAYGNFGSKIKRALELQLTGASDVRIVSENALLASFEANGAEALDVLHQQENRFAQQWASAKVVTNSFGGLTDGQQRAFDLVVSGRNIFLTGLGGTGKSYILNKIIKWARSRDKNVVACAPTGIAAINVGGSTIHRVLGIRPGKTLRDDVIAWVPSNSPIAACDLLIVDEVSMCRLDLFDYLSSALRIAARNRAKEGRPPCQLVVVGDFCQLPPVIKEDERPLLEKKYGRDVGGGYPFMGNEWSKWNFERVELTEAIRQRDANFVAALNACRVGDVTGVHWIEQHSSKVERENSIVICGYNAVAERENRERLARLDTPPFTYVGEINGEVEPSDRPTSTKLTLKKNARVMMLVNVSEDTCMNGSLGTVFECRDHSVDVLFDNGILVNVGYHEWDITKPALVDGRVRMQTIGTFTQIPLKLAYAITIHKSQGQTFDAATIYPECWDAGQLYTALSRLSSIDGLHLQHHCNDDFLITSEDVLLFNEGKWTPDARESQKASASHESYTAKREEAPEAKRHQIAIEPTSKIAVQDEASLENYGITPAAGLNVLHKSGITTINQLSSMSDEQLMSLPGMGKTKMKRLREILRTTAPNQ